MKTITHVLLHRVYWLAGQSVNLDASLYVEHDMGLDLDKTGEVLKMITRVACEPVTKTIAHQCHPIGCGPVASRKLGRISSDGSVKS